tara:strand:- start:2 stop:841 length:840 start_codon:yes stop_codon:yes gene_type:complete
MPTANRKDLVNDKMQIYYNSERQEEKENRIYNEDFHNNLSNLTNGSFDEEGKESSPYNEKQDTITDRLNEMLAQMEKEKPKPSKKSVPNNHTSSQKINKTVAKVEDPYEEIDMEAWEKGQENDFFATTRKERFAKKGDELKTDNTIYAVIQGDQIVKHRSRVNLRLSKDAIINGEIFKKNTMFYATATIQYNRLNLKITNIAHEKVDLNVYDGQDGAVGLYVETPNIASAVGNGVTEDVIDETDASNIPFGNTIKNIFSKKQKEERIQLLNNTKLILMP